MEKQITKYVLVFCVLLGLVQSRPEGSPEAKEEDAYIVHYEHDNNSDGGYVFAYETSDGIAREEEAEVVNLGSEDEHIVMRGSYSYVGPDGVLYTVSYVADKLGFRPTGTHLPSGNLI